MGEHPVDDLNDDEGDVQRGRGREGRAECAGGVGMIMAMMTVAVMIVRMIVAVMIVFIVGVTAGVTMVVMVVMMVVPAGFLRCHAFTVP
jgi:hypothetical protein